MGTSGPRQAIYKIAATMMEGMAFQVDDPEYPDEPYAFRCWRTIENGYTVMDVKRKADPGFRTHPRIEWVSKPVEVPINVPEL